MAKRELIDTGSDKRYVRRNKRGQFNESDDVGRSLAADRRRSAKTKRKTAAKASRKGTRKTAARKGTARKSARKKAAKRSR